MIDKKTDTRNLVDGYKGMANLDIKNDMKNRSFNFHVAIENFQYDFNIGTIVRNANAFNCRAVHIIGKKQWNKRGAMATNKYLDVLHYESVDKFMSMVHDSGLKLIGVDNIKNSKSLNQTKFTENCILVFVQEGPGLSKEIDSNCDSLVKIDQYGSTRSVNVGVASGIVMYEYTNQMIGMGANCSSTD